ncbi:MAG: hypothetical protein EOP11_16050 [Proteobacteria bacterium]|nr:MAG: hypothetical protein EOP11_16050 [Pseudomonadota bacterium]
MKKFLAPLALGFALLSGAAAQAQTNLSLVADGNFAQNVAGGGANSGDRALGIGGGLLLESRSSPNFGVEVGGLYHARKFSAGNYTTNAIQVPLLLRFYLSNYISLGLGGFFEYGVGDAYNGSDVNKTNYGAMGSLGIYIPVGATTKFVIDGRYGYGLKDISDGPFDIKTRDIQILAGLRFGF